MSANTLVLTDANFESEVLSSEQPVLVDFWAPWCGPCKMIAPTIDAVAAEYSGKARVGKVNTDDQQNLAVEYGITAIPTLLLFHQGQVVDQVRGLRSKRDLKESLDRVAV